MCVPVDQGRYSSRLRQPSLHRVALAPLAKRSSAVHFVFTNGPRRFAPDKPTPLVFYPSPVKGP